MDRTAHEIRRIILEESKRAGVGHIGSALSVADIVAVLYSRILRAESAEDPERDRFVLSKGHAALALYAALHVRGWIDTPLLATFCADGTPLGVHPDAAVAAIDYSTGSLGQGLGVGAGYALAAKLRGSARRVFVLLSDAECNEGSVWESIAFSAHHKLTNLTAIVDANGQQALGYTNDVLSFHPLAERWRAFQWDVRECDGHDEDALAEAMSPDDRTGPRVVIANTIFGKGVSFMQRQIKWHYSPMSDAEYASALSETGNRH
ncbi:MAG TPA: transketolase [Thermoanaerobaculia bacterium]|nr:transketolase [Thermoanaerobaculia bacterium]